MPRRKKEITAAPISEATQFRLVSREVETGLFEVRLLAEGVLDQSGQVGAAPEVTVEVERLTCISRDFIESMGGEAPYDRFEVRWPLEVDARQTLALALQTARDEAGEKRGADSLPFQFPIPIEWQEIDLAGQTTAKVVTEAEHSAITTFHVDEGGMSCQIGSTTYRFRSHNFGFLRRPGLKEEQGFLFEPCSLEAFHAALDNRNAALGVAVPTSLPRAPLSQAPLRLERRQSEFPVHTGEEWTAFIQSAADGRLLRHFSGNEQSGILRHQRPDTAFFTETTLLEEERKAGHGIELLQNAAAQLDIDDGLAWLYISHLLAPPSPLAPNAYAGGWVDLDDVARRTMGGYARNPKEAGERRAKVWRAIRYGARSHIGGKRSVPYFDKTSGKEILTEIYTSPWQIVSRQQTGQLPLFAHDEEEAPVRVELVASREWTALTTEASTAQYLPFGEVLGALPANQAGGAWARVLGLAYINWCRRRVQQALAGQELPTRRELLDAFPSKVAPYRDILVGKDPRRALSYWQSAETWLQESQIIEEGGAPYQPQARKGWQSVWLGERPDWKPGALLRPVLEGLEKRRFAPASRQLGKPARKRQKRRDLPSNE
jgi:hypothetical protein